ncbi:MAG: branched-chain amino acid transaminase [Gammaproteobacteria bacterium]|nr:branched-chain amino acid transaminase [Gammaproteobacteria bacterium]
MADDRTSFANRDGVIWQDGDLVPWRSATTHVLTHTIHYGVGVFEGIRAYATPKGTSVFRLREHTRRLFDSAQIVRMDIPFSREELIKAQLEVIKANELEECYVRPVVYYGSEAMGLRAENLSVHVSIGCWPWPDYMDADSQERGICVGTSSLTRHHVNISMCKAKVSGNYVNSILALSEARDGGYDEALMLDNEGYVAEGTGENVFMIRDGVIHTPQLTSCLPGITRDSILAFANELGYKVIERNITRDEFYIADEAFFTGTAAEVLPIRELDHRVIGNGNRGPVTEKLQTMYMEEVRGIRENYPEWHTVI